MKLNIADKKIIISYLQATSNEITLDILAYKMLNLSPEKANFIPRPTKLLKYSKTTIIKVFIFFWKHILCNIFFSIQFLYLLLLKLDTEKINSSIMREKSVGIAYSDRAMDIINKTNCGISPEYWIVFPWNNLLRLDKYAIRINVLSLISYKELYKAFYFAMLIHKKIKKSHKYKNWHLQSYTAFKWLVIRFGIEKVVADFFIAEHFDRWAVMIDCIVYEQNRNSLNSSITLVQHGLVFDFNEATFLLPYKLRMLKNLYLFDKDSEIYFRKNIIANKSLNVENVNFYKNLLTLKIIPENEKIIILFVGHSICLDLHIHILNELKKKNNFIAYYKPHPTEKITKHIENQDWNVIKDKYFFPKVDFLISYNSTLILEYKILGINAIVHDIRLNIDSSKKYIQDVEKEMDCVKQYNKIELR